MARDVSRIQGIKLFVYCDNNPIIGTSPKAVWQAVNRIKEWADNILCQPIHTNIGVQRLDEVHPIDYCGYLFYPDHTLLRKETKYRFKRKFNKTKDRPELHQQVLASYKGWLEHCNGLNLWRKVTGMKKFSDLNIVRNATMRDGKRF